MARLFLMRSQEPLGLEQMEAFLFFWPQSTVPKGRKGKRQVIVIRLISAVAIPRANQSPRSDTELIAKTQADGGECLRFERF